MRNQTSGLGKVGQWHGWLKSHMPRGILSNKIANSGQRKNPKTAARSSSALGTTSCGFGDQEILTSEYRRGAFSAILHYRVLPFFAISSLQGAAIVIQN